MSKSKKTKTSQFGSKNRSSHDSTLFYSGHLYDAFSKEDTSEFVESVIPEDVLDKVYCKSSENMDELSDNSIHLLITSPPYNVQKEYDHDLSFEEYLALLESVFKEVYRVLVPGGRVCINVANLGRKPYVPLNSFISQMLLDIGFLMRGEIIWNKEASAGSSTAWGSWMSASNPTLRDMHEYILIFSKSRYQRDKKGKETTISKDEFLEYTRSIWVFPAESASKVGHPAPFPTELPRRLIQLYSYKGDVILDPFIGSGTTAVAAVQSDRHFIGYENLLEYVELCEKRIVIAMNRQLPLI